MNYAVFAVELSPTFTKNGSHNTSEARSAEDSL